MRKSVILEIPTNFVVQKAFPSLAKDGIGESENAH